MTVTVQESLPSMPEPPQPAPPRRRSEDYETWLEEVRPVFVEVAASGRKVTCYQVVDEYGLSEPPDGAHQWGRFMAQLHTDGIFKVAGWACSKRPTANDSGVRQWQGTKAAREGRLS